MRIPVNEGEARKAESNEIDTSTAHDLNYDHYHGWVGKKVILAMTAKFPRAQKAGGFGRLNRHAHMGEFFY